MGSATASWGSASERVGRRYHVGVALARFRGRIPVVVFVLLVLLCLVLIGVACACFGEMPLQVLDRASGAAPPLAAVIEVWPLVVALLALATFGLVVAQSTRPSGRASPAFLQRFLS